MIKSGIYILLIVIFSSTSISAIDQVRSYSEQMEFIEKLNDHFSLEIIGKTSYGQSEYPIYKISYNQVETMIQKKILIISGVHGNEPAPVYAIEEFILELNDIEVEYPYLSIDFIYILNPWGFEYNQRLNGDGIDINRDFFIRESQEINFMLNSLEGSEYHKVFDFHEASSNGFFLYCYGLKNRKLSKEIRDYLYGHNVLMENEYEDVILTVKNGILYVPFYASLYMKIKKTITSGLYFHNEKVPQVFTFETSKNQNITERIRINRILLDYIISL